MNIKKDYTDFNAERHIQNNKPSAKITDSNNWYYCLDCWKGNNFSPATTIFYCAKCGNGTCAFPKTCDKAHKC